MRQQNKNQQTEKQQIESILIAIKRSAGIKIVGARCRGAGGGFGDLRGWSELKRSQVQASLGAGCMSGSSGG